MARSYFMYSHSWHLVFNCFVARATPSTTREGNSAQEKPAKPQPRKTFDRAELSSLDAVFKATSGMPTAAMIKRLTETLNLEKGQVFLRFKRSLKRHANSNKTIYLLLVYFASK